MKKSPKYNKRRLGRNRQIFVIISLVVLLNSIAAGATLAWLNDRTDSVVNVFTPGEVEITINEPNWDGLEKKNVKIENTGKIPAKIRAKVVVTWQNDEGIYPELPEACTCTSTCNDTGHSYKIVMDTRSWTGSAGGWYTTTAEVPVGQEVQLITSCKPIDGREPAGYYLVVDIIAEAIQAVGGASF